MRRLGSTPPILVSVLATGACHDVGRTSSPYARAALAGVLVGVLAGGVAYGVFRYFGVRANLYLLGAIVVACIPGSVTLSLILKSDTLPRSD